MQITGVTENGESSVKAAEEVSVDHAQDFLANYDFSYVQYRLIKIEHWSEVSATKIMRQYKNFLYLQKKYGDQQHIIPSLEIDEVWHAHILYTKDYAEFCQQFFGRFLHHVPQKPGVAADSKSKVEQDFAATQELYKQEFGDYIYQVPKRSLLDWLLGR